MRDFGSWTDLLACLCLLVVFIFGWGKAKTAIAKVELKKAERLLGEERAKEAIKCLEQVRKDLDRMPRFWYLLGLAFARMGSAKQAEEAFHRTLEKDAGYLNTRQLLATLRELPENPPPDAASGPRGDAGENRVQP